MRPSHKGVDHPLHECSEVEKIYDTIGIQNLLMSVRTGEMGEESLRLPRIKGLAALMT